MGRRDTILLLNGKNVYKTEGCKSAVWETGETLKRVNLSKYLADLVCPLLNFAVFCTLGI